jgi:hypothetical protein
MTWSDIHANALAGIAPDMANSFTTHTSAELPATFRKRRRFYGFSLWFLFHQSVWVSCDLLEREGRLA